MPLPADTARASRYRRRWWRREPRLILAGLAVTAAGLGGLATEVSGSNHSGQRTVHVQAGDTVWNIAAAAYGSNDLRSRVADIIDENHLEGSVLVPGQALTLPAP